MKVIKRIAIIVFLIIAFMMMLFEPAEPGGNLTPYMSDVVYIPQKVYAKGKPKKIKKKHLSAYEYLGRFTLTAYCGCSKCCGNDKGITASGNKVKANHTIAVDKKVIPLGTKIKIDKTIYTAEDTGGAIRGNRIDVYIDNHKDALDFGVKRNIKVYKVKEKELWQNLSRLKTLKQMTKVAHSL